jgi:hypothetical protein
MRTRATGDVRGRLVCTQTLGRAALSFVAAVSDHITAHAELSEKTHAVLEAVGIDRVGDNAAELQRALTAARQETQGLGALFCCRPRTVTGVS